MHQVGDDKDRAKQKQEKQLLCLAPPVSLLLRPRGCPSSHLQPLQQMRPILAVRLLHSLQHASPPLRNTKKKAIKCRTA